MMNGILRNLVMLAIFALVFGVASAREWAWAGPDFLCDDGRMMYLSPQVAVETVELRGAFEALPDAGPGSSRIGALKRSVSRRNELIGALRAYVGQLHEGIQQKRYPVRFTTVQQQTVGVFIEQLLVRLEKQVAIDRVSFISNEELAVFVAQAQQLVVQGKMESLAFLLANLDGIHEAHEVCLRDQVSWVRKQSASNAAVSLRNFLTEMFEYGLCRGTTTSLVDFALRGNGGVLTNPPYRDRILFTLLETTENHYWSSVALWSNEETFSWSEYAPYKDFPGAITQPEQIILFFDIEKMPLLRVIAGEKSAVVNGAPRDIAEAHTAGNYRGINIVRALTFDSKVKVIEALRRAGAPLPDYLWDDPEWAQARAAADPAGSPDRRDRVRQRAMEFCAAGCIAAAI
ncbi:MAG: hypothetical protein NC924_01800 [Candidatus Omnitrophica bacterium]|nr:hypothetical protein [Candidatus Omnitrophota bacterium]